MPGLNRPQRVLRRPIRVPWLALAKYLLWDRRSSFWIPLNDIELGTKHNFVVCVYVLFAFVDRI